jgi:hypothetical protein
MSDILEELDDLWEKVSDIDSVTVLQAREEIVKLRAEARDAADENEKLRAALLRAKEFFLRDEPLAACIEVCAALGDKE